MNGRSEHELLVGDPPFVYAGFWERLGAMIVDFGVFLVLLPFIQWLQHHYRLYDWYAVGPWMVLDIVYFAWLVSRYGGTPGKLLFRMRIVRVDGSPIGMSRAMLRQTPELVLWVVRAMALAMPLLAMTDSEYLQIASNLGVRYRILQASAPQWYETANILYRVWIYSELVVLLTNKKRRALHDFLAGSVVIKVRRHVV